MFRYCVHSCVHLVLLSLVQTRALTAICGPAVVHGRLMPHLSEFVVVGRVGAVLLVSDGLCVRVCVCVRTRQGASESRVHRVWTSFREGSGRVLPFSVERGL